MWGGLELKIALASSAVRVSVESAMQHAAAAVGSRLVPGLDGCHMAACPPPPTSSYTCWPLPLTHIAGFVGRTNDSLQTPLKTNGVLVVNMSLWDWG